MWRIHIKELTVEKIEDVAYGHLLDCSVIEDFGKTAVLCVNKTGNYEVTYTCTYCIGTAVLFCSSNRKELIYSLCKNKH